jgi:hypothetical protein
MSQSQGPTPIPVNLEINPNQPNWDQGEAEFPISITNNDGTAPAMNTLAGIAASSIVANTGTNSLFPPAQFPIATYPFLGSITAAGAGAGQIDLVTDGTTQVIFAVAVALTTPEGAGVDPTKIVVTPPQPPAS